METEQIKLEVKINQRDTCMLEIYEKNILWCVVHEDLFSNSPDVTERLRDGETVKLTLQIDKPLDLE